MTMQLTHRRPDGSFVATVNGWPYHIVEGDPLYWEQAQAEAAELGEALPFEPVPVPPAPTLDDYRRAAQNLIDETAQQRGYDSGMSCASYANSTHADWSNEASFFIEWRDTVWIVAQATLADVQAGKIPAPSVAEFLDSLPGLEWPA